MGFLKTLGKIGGAISGFGPLVNLVGGIFDSSSTNKNIDKQIAAQQEENRLNREYNLSLAKMQNQWNIEQWNRENAYNTPEAQMQRYIEAGLNPDLIYGQQNMSAQSPQMTAGAPSSPVDMTMLAHKKTIGQVLRDSVMYERGERLADAEIRNKNANSGKSEAETEGILTDNSFKKLLNENAVKLGNLNIQLAGADLDMKPHEKELLRETINKTKQETSNLEATFHQIQQVTSNLTFAQYKARVELWLNQAKTQAEIKEIASRLKLNYQQARKIAMDVAWAPALNQASINLMNMEAFSARKQGYLAGEQANTAYWNGQRGEWELNLDQEDIMKNSGTGRSINSILGAFNGLASVLLGFMLAGKAPKIPKLGRTKTPIGFHP